MDCPTCHEPAVTYTSYSDAGAERVSFCIHYGWRQGEPCSEAEQQDLAERVRQEQEAQG